MSKTLMSYTLARGKCAKKYITFPIFRALTGTSVGVGKCQLAAEDWFAASISCKIRDPIERSGPALLNYCPCAVCIFTGGKSAGGPTFGGNVPVSDSRNVLRSARSSKVRKSRAWISLSRCGLDVPPPT